MKPILLEIPEKFESERVLISIYENGDGKEFYQILQSKFPKAYEFKEESRPTHTAPDSRILHDFRAVTVKVVAGWGRYGTEPSVG